MKKLIITIATILVVLFAGYLISVKSFNSGKLSACKEIYSNLYDKLHIDIDRDDLERHCKAMTAEDKLEKQ